MYGNTEKAALALAESLKNHNIPFTLHNLNEESYSFALRDVFKYDTVILGYIDQATTFAEGQGGGGGGNNDMKWGRNDDEDDRRWAHRCLAMANRMMRPKGSKSRKR